MLFDVPDCVFTNALLNHAVERVLKERGVDRIASVLNPFAALISVRIVPESQKGLRPSGADAFCSFAY